MGLGALGVGIFVNSGHAGRPYSMRLGIVIAPTAPPHNMASEALALQEAGVSAVWVPDHLSGGTHFRPPWFAMPIVLAAIAERCSDVLLGPLVASMVLRPAATLRSEMEAVAAIAPGRLRVALGVGSRSDANVTGLSRSAAHLAEYADDTVSLAYPLYIASSSPGTIAVAACFDGWVSAGPRPEKTYSALDVAFKIALYDQLSPGVPPGAHRIVLIDLNEPNPWISEASMLDTLVPWVGRADEVVLWHPRTFGALVGITPTRAVSLAGSITG